MEKEKSVVDFDSDDRLTSLEKYVLNMNQMFCRMSERLEHTEAEIIKCTMKYNVLKSQSSSLIQEQVDRRLSVSLQAHTFIQQASQVKNTVKQVEMMMQQEKAVIRFFGEKLKSLEIQIDGEKERVNKQLNMQQLSLTSCIDVLGTTLRQEMKNIRQFMVKNSDDLQEIRKEIQRETQQRTDLLQKIIVQVSELDNILNQNKQELENKFNIACVEVQKATARADHTIAEAKKQLQMKIHNISSQFDCKFRQLKHISQQQQTNHNFLISKANNDISNIKISTSIQLEKQNRIQQQFSTQLNSFVQSMTSFKLQFNQQMIDSKKNYIQLADSIDTRLSTEALLRLLKQLAPKLEIGSPTRSSNLNVQQGSREQEDPRAKMLRGWCEDRSMNMESQPAEDLSSKNNLSPHSPFRRRTETQCNQYSRITTSTLNRLRQRIADCEQALSILKQMGDCGSKVNQSDILKLQESKCSKVAFKELLQKLQTFRTLLEKGLKDQMPELCAVKFDQTSYSTFGRLTSLKNYHSQNGTTHLLSQPAVHGATPIQNSAFLEQKRASKKSMSQGQNPKNGMPLMRNLTKSRKHHYIAVQDRSESQEIQQRIQ